MFMSYDYMIDDTNSKSVDFDRILSISYLFGFKTKFDNLRILEIGCGDGIRLIAAAEGNPSNIYVGISDCSDVIQTNQHIIEELDFTNVNLYNMSLESFYEANSIIFDLVIVNNVYSWVDQNSQIVILNILEKYLAASGLVFIDYNTMPGWHMQNALRGMIQHHVQSYTDKLEKIKQAKSFLRFLKLNSTSSKEEKELLNYEISAIDLLSDASFYREFISENNWPVYFSNMVGKLNSFNLAYIGDYDLKTMSSQDMPKDAQDALILSPNLIESEQYMDFFRNRRGRKSIICRAEAATTSQSGLDPTKLYDMNLSANNLLISNNVNDLCNNEPLSLNIGGEFDLTIADPLVKVALKILTDHSPGQLSFQNLLLSSSECLSISGCKSNSEEHKEILAYQLCLLYSCLTARTIDVTVNKRHIASYIHHSPKASKSSRLLAGSSGVIMNLNLCAVNLDENERKILCLLDGSLSYAKIVDAFEGSFGEEAIDKSGYVLATLNKFLNYALLVN